MSEDEKMPNRDLLKLEHQECVSHDRFVVSIRFTYFVSFTTFFFALVGGYHYIWATEAKVFGVLKPALLFVAAVFGLVTLSVAWMVERRCIHIYRACDDRAAILERLMGIEGGIRMALADPARRRRRLGIIIAHSTAISLLYGAVATIWLLLATLSGYQAWPSLEVILKGGVR